MKIDSRHLAIAVAISLAIMWVICSLFVALIPEAVMSLTGVMIHAELSAFTWSLTWANFFIGLV
ncbi:MAG: DUF5676 family membrane protein, partial [Thiolinea sp.]